MPPNDPLVELPDRIELTLDEVASILAALDVADLAARTDTERRTARTAIRIVTTKLWPELGGLFDDEE